MQGQQPVFFSFPFLVLLKGNDLENKEGAKWFYQQKLKIQMQIKQPLACFLPSCWCSLGTWRQWDVSRTVFLEPALYLALEHVFRRTFCSLGSVGGIADGSWSCLTLGDSHDSLIIQLWCRQEAWPVPCNLHPHHAWALKVPLAFILTYILIHKMSHFHGSSSCL